MNLRWYWMLNPPRGGFKDTGQPAFSKELAFPRGERVEAALFLDEDGQPKFVRIQAFGAANAEDTDRFVDLVETAKEHMLSVLKLTWNQNCSYVPASFFVPGDDKNAAEATVEVHWPSYFNFNADAAHAVFSHAIHQRESLRLLADGLDDSVPLQYRFLSLYKLLELKFRGEDGHWDFLALHAACQPQLDAFMALGLRRTFVAELNHLRDRCAHIRTGAGAKRRVGVTALNPTAFHEVRRLLPLLTEVCRGVLNHALDGKVVFKDLRPWYELQSPKFSDQPGPGAGG